MNPYPPISPAPIFIAGSTAVGKSAVALRLAEQIGGEIISVDSMQVYRGLNIGTAKPSAEEQRIIPHHLLDVVDLTESFDASRFCDLAQKALAPISGRGRIPIFCGGTGLYFKAFLHGLGEAPPSDEKLRAELEAAPLEALLQELAEKDPVTFARIDKRNPRRVIRAMEVIRLTGQPFSIQRADWQTSDEPRTKPENLFGFSREPGDLRRRIDARVEEMFDQGLVSETQRLLSEGLDKNPTAMQAIGYRQVVEHLRGLRCLPDTVELVKIRTRQFAKRQMTYFRRQLYVDWIHLPPAGDPSQAADTIAARYHARTR